ncbi:hypothetical protein MSG28_004452 [Choristoneura fumiferana]|uniref:Uncharacterized protein n=1 Tax=Choristoneura fumiferana TaxID=7141 RepID=A0ACC0K611_CHOFU|nr:hypothetical protein MSG28_004452 [Choristoneura fumiferana]
MINLSPPGSILPGGRYLFHYAAVPFRHLVAAIRQRAKKQRSAKTTTSGIASAASSGTAAVVIENVAQTQRLQDEKPTNTASASGSNEDEEDDNSFDRTEMGVYADELATTRSARFMLAAVVEETGLLARKLWCRLNRLRTGHGRCHYFRHKWGWRDSALCECGEEAQTMEHIVQRCPLHSYLGSPGDLYNLKPDTISGLGTLNVDL